jgi:hypothetical protein
LGSWSISSADIRYLHESYTSDLVMCSLSWLQGKHTIVMFGGNLPDYSSTLACEFQIFRNPKSSHLRHFVSWPPRNSKNIILADHCGADIFSGRNPRKTASHMFRTFDKGEKNFRGLKWKPICGNFGRPVIYD